LSSPRFEDVEYREEEDRELEGEIKKIKIKKETNGKNT
jgi:hypothetical protein